MPESTSDQRRLTAIMFTDMLGFSALSQRDEKRALLILEEQREIVRAALLPYGGHEIKTAGDGFLISFASALEAVRCGIAIQSAVAERNRNALGDEKFQLRIGIHVGDVVERDGDLIGDGVNVASRIEPLASPGGICITGPVFDQIRNKIPEQVLLMGRPELKNIEIPIDIYGVALPWEDAPSPLPSPSHVPASSPSRRVILAAFAALAILALAFAVTSMNRGTSAPQSAVTPAIAPKAAVAPTIAVMPFANHSRDGEDAYLADGLTEAVAISLSKISALQVIDRYSVYSDRGKTGEARDIKKSLMASHLLEGSVQKEGDDLAIRIHLANSTDGRIIWSSNYQRKMGTILKMDQEVAEEVARGLRITLLPSDRERLSRTADNPEAYEYYLKGREQQLKFGPDTLTKSIQLFNASLKLSPHYAPAQAAIARSYTLLSTNYKRPREVMPKAREAALEAIKDDDTVAEAHIALGYVYLVYDWDFPSAEGEFKRAIELDSGSSDAYVNFGLLLTARGRIDDAVKYFQTAQEKDPLSVVTSNWAELGYFISGRFDDARRQCEHTLTLDNQFALSHWNLALTLIEMGDFKRAISEGKLAVQFDMTNPLMYTAGVQATAKSGDQAAALNMLKALLNRARNRYVCPYEVAMVYLSLHQDENAFNSLDRAIEERADCIAFSNVDPRLNRVRDDARFKAFVKKAGVKL